MIGLIKKLIRSLLVRLLWYFPKNTAHKILYFFQMKKRLDLLNPKDFNEKIQWLIVYEYGKKEAKLADKYLVREYVKEKGYKNILPKLYGIYQNVNEIDIKSLPNNFVLKTNNGSGGVSICRNKNDYDFNKAKKMLNQLIKYNYSKHSLEYHYQYIKPLIICEEYLDDGINMQPEDYKFYCFNGKVECVLLCSNRGKNLRRDYYDTDWNYLNYSLKKYQSNNIHPKPKKFEHMIEIAEKLSENFKFVRVDLYEINGRIYFGELTFTPASGLNSTLNNESLIKLGKLINIGE